MAKRTNLGTVFTLVVMFIVALVFWDYPFLYPLKLFVVLLHELGHGTAAVLTGGHIHRIELSANLGGACWSTGGIRALVLPAGYLGSMLFGGLILVGAARSRHDKLMAIVLGGAVLGLTVLFVRNTFGFLFGLAFGLVLMAAGKFLSPRVNDLMLKFLGLTSCMYAVVDIKEDLISRTVPGSDAYQMSQVFFLPPVFWGVLWILIALVVSAYLIRVAARGSG